MLALALCCLAAVSTGPLSDYLSRQDGKGRWSGSRFESRRALKLTSQSWRGLEWRHDLVFVEPRERGATDAAILYITGGDPDPNELNSLQFLADSAQMTVATLYHVPNQPLWDLIEDDLIAHTFERFLDTGESDWPLLLPMTRAAIAAMDAVVDSTKTDAQPIRRFVVSGMSKRGWTTWLTGASGDPRVVGIAPIVYDNLDIPAQMKRQRELWQSYSPQINDYTERGLQARLTSERGESLVAIVDPLAYRQRLTLPKLIVTGSNDPYWPVDALGLYWVQLLGPKWSLVVPNAGHNVLDRGPRPWQTVATFARSCAGLGKMPSFGWSVRALELILEADTEGLVDVRLWMAKSSTNRFDEAEWKVARTWGPKAKVVVEVERGEASLLEARYERDGRSFSLTTGAIYHPDLAGSDG